MRPGLAGLDMDSTLFRPATYLEMAISKLSVAILIGAALIVVALGAFLLDARAALVGSLAILLSFLDGGRRALPERRRAQRDGSGRPGRGHRHRRRRRGDRGRKHRADDCGSTGRRRAANRLRRIILEAALESRGTMLYATMIMLLVALPAFFLGGPTGAFMHASGRWVLPGSRRLDGRRADRYARAGRHAAPELAARRHASRRSSRNRNTATARRFAARGKSAARVRRGLRACIGRPGDVSHARERLVHSHARGTRPGRRSRGCTGHLASGNESDGEPGDSRAAIDPGQFALSALTSDGLCSPTRWETSTGRVVGQPRSRRRLRRHRASNSTRSWTDIRSGYRRPHLSGRVCG